MRVLPLGEAAAQLSWLSPCAASLAALARAPTTAWFDVRHDPGALLLVVRCSPPLQTLPFFSPGLLGDPVLLERSTTIPDDLGPPNWNHTNLNPVWRGGVAIARMASQLAESFGRCDPEAAWIAGLLAPLGWLAAAAVAPIQVARCLDDPAHSQQPSPTQRQHWGLDQAAIGRRLARRWGLPGWLAAVVGHLSLPTHLTLSLGADPALFQVVQLAVALVQNQGVRLGLCTGATPIEILDGLGRPAAELGRLEEEAGEVVREPLPESDWKAPRDEPLLPDLIALAIDNRRLRDAGSLRHLEGDLDELHRLLAEQRRGEADRLREQKLGALAEFAAGAGHEINNPLAVISGQAQYLLGHEPDPQRQKSLQTIIQQTQRIHSTLRELMQFSRPSRPCPQTFDLMELFIEVAASLADLAEQRRVRISRPDSADRQVVTADRGQITAVLLALVRNAVEAALPDGWVRLRLEAMAGPCVEAIVEDSGEGLRGLSPAHREHIFDPFSPADRQAAVGALGLPTAWRLARENGGDVRWDADAVGLTRFILRLPLSSVHADQVSPRFDPIPA